MGISRIFETFLEDTIVNLTSSKIQSLGNEKKNKLFFFISLA